MKYMYQYGKYLEDADMTLKSDHLPLQMLTKEHFYTKIEILPFKVTFE